MDICNRYSPADSQAEVFGLPLPAERQFLNLLHHPMVRVVKYSNLVLSKWRLPARVILQLVTCKHILSFEINDGPFELTEHCETFKTWSKRRGKKY